MLASEDKKKALTNPSSVFKHPADVVACKDLDKTEKAAILKQWELDARLLQVATEEGMTEGERSLFADVKKAQEKLDLPTSRRTARRPRWARNPARSGQKNGGGLSTAATLIRHPSVSPAGVPRTRSGRSGRIAPCRAECRSSSRPPANPS